MTDLSQLFNNESSLIKLDLRQRIYELYKWAHVQFTIILNNMNKMEINFCYNQYSHWKCVQILREINNNFITGFCGVVVITSA